MMVITQAQCNVSDQYTPLHCGNSNPLIQAKQYVKMVFESVCNGLDYPLDGDILIALSIVSTR